MNLACPKNGHPEYFSPFLFFWKILRASYRGVLFICSSGRVGYSAHNEPHIYPSGGRPRLKNQLWKCIAFFGINHSRALKCPIYKALRSLSYTIATIFVTNRQQNARFYTNCPDLQTTNHKLKDWPQGFSIRHQGRGNQPFWRGSE